MHLGKERWGKSKTRSEARERRRRWSHVSCTCTPCTSPVELAPPNGFSQWSCVCTMKGKASRRMKSGDRGTREEFARTFHIWAKRNEKLKGINKLISQKKLKAHQKLLLSEALVCCVLPPFMGRPPPPC